MKKLAPILIALLFLATSCASPNLLESTPVLATPSVAPSVTPPPLPDILPLLWASETETGIVRPEKMFPLVGAIDKKHRRTIDLEYAGLRIAVVLGEGVDLQDSKIIASLGEIRSFYSAELNIQKSLKQQLEQVRVLLAKQGNNKNAVVLIEGQNWPQDLTVSPTNGYVSQVIKFDIAKQGEVLTRYVLENGELRQLSSEEEPNLLPRLYIDGAYIKRYDTEEIVQLKGVNLAAFASDRGNRFQYAYDVGLKYLIEQKWNVNLIRVFLDSIWIHDTGMLPELDKFVEFAEKNGMYVVLHVGQMNDSINNGLPDASVAPVMGELALRYSSKTNLLYELWGEPTPDVYLGALKGVEHYNNYDEAWALWLEAAKPIAESIRSNNPDSIVIVPGGRYWARDTSYYLVHPFEVFDRSDNIMYDIHDYPDFTNPETFTIYPDELPDRPRNLPHGMALTRAYAKKIVDEGIAPILFGEFGGSVPETPELAVYFNTDRELENMIDILILANSNAGTIHTAFWAVDNDDANSFGLFNLGTDSLTNRGFLIYYDLTGKFHPQTPENLKELFGKLFPISLPTNLMN